MQKTIGWIGKRLPRQSPDDAKAGRFRICQKAGLSPGEIAVKTGLAHKRGHAPAGEVLRQRMGRTLKVYGPAVVKQGVKDGVWTVESSFW